MEDNTPRVVVIVGPTAVGKSRLAMRLCDEFSGAIVSADSRQVYRYMDIGTDKPTRAEQATIEHFLIDVVAPDDTYSAQRFRREGVQVLRRLGALRRPAVVAGGTGFYMQSLLDSPVLPDVPPDAAYRAELQEEASSLGPGALHARLAALDPASAARIHPHNVPRVLRALEIVRAVGGPVPEPARRPETPALFLGLDRPRTELWAVADRRVLDQVRAGLPEETRLLLEMGYGADLPAMQGFGYRQMVEYLRGDISLAEAIERYRTEQHKYMRRQMTWFRRDPRITWLDASGDPYPEARDLVDAWMSRP